VEEEEAAALDPRKRKAKGGPEEPPAIVVESPMAKILKSKGPKIKLMDLNKALTIAYDIIEKKAVSEYFREQNPNQVGTTNVV